MGVFSGLNSSKDLILEFLSKTPFYKGNKRFIMIIKQLYLTNLFNKNAENSNTQEVFGRILNEIGKEESDLSKK